MRTFISATLFLLLISPLFGGEEARPNILFIHMEDMGCQIGAYGDHTAYTPNLDKLADGGVTFNRANVSAATCAASRGSLYTGLYPHQNGIMGFVKTHGFHLREGLHTYVHYLKEAGYYTGITYKNGLDTNGPTPWDLNGNWRTNFVTPDDNQNEVKNSIDNFRYFMQTRPKDKPFYFQSQNSNTHTPWAGPKVDKHFSIKGMPGADAYQPIDPKTVHPLPHFRDGFKMNSAVRKWLGDYYGAIQRVDYFVGQILSILEESGEADNTIIVFSADHGPSDLTRGKTTPYEFGLQVPFIVNWPNRGQSGVHSDALVSFVDIMPTFLELAGIDRPGYLAGHSLLPAITGEKPLGDRKYLFSAYVAHTTGVYWPTRTINDGRYKLIHNLLGDSKTTPGEYSRNQNSKHIGTNGYRGPVASAIRQLSKGTPARIALDRGYQPPAFELYDLEEDPGEFNNLMGNPDYREVGRALLEQLLIWREDGVCDPFLDKNYLQAFSEDYAKKVAFYYENVKSKAVVEGYSKLNKWGSWKLDFDKWIPAWDPDGYRQDPKLQAVD
jgi:N-sulfoglucosamine sulfohydrolase